MQQARLNDLIDTSGFKIYEKKPSVLCFAFSASPLSLQAIYIQLSAAWGLKSFSDYNSTTILYLQSFCREATRDWSETKSSCSSSLPVKL